MDLCKRRAVRWPPIVLQGNGSITGRSRRSEKNRKENPTNQVACSGSRDTDKMSRDQYRRSRDQDMLGGGKPGIVPGKHKVK